MFQEVVPYAWVGKGRGERGERGGKGERGEGEGRGGVRREWRKVGTIKRLRSHTT